MRNLFLALTFLMSNSALALVNCEPLSEILKVEDAVCDEISASVEDCYGNLNYHFAVNKFAKGKVRSETRARVIGELIADYERELAAMRQKHIYQSKIGDGRACTNDMGRVQEWINFTERDLHQLKSPRF